MGRVAAPYGVKGWVKVVPLTAAPTTLLGYAQWWIRERADDAAWQPRTLEAGRQHGRTLAVQLSGLRDRETAGRLSGADIGVPRDLLPAVAAHEIYWADLVGLRVVNREDLALGSVEAVREYGAHPVLRVMDDNGRERLIPFVDAYVDEVDVAAGRIVVDWRQDY